MQKLYSFLLLFSISISLAAQEQLYTMMDRTDLNLRQVESWANRYFDSAGTGRGTGYKQYQRWLYERKFHTDENGNYISMQTDWNNYQHSLPSLTHQNRTSAGSWTELGPWGWNRTSGWNPGTGRISAVAVLPSNEQVIYVGSPGGGLWKTVNGGVNWQPLTDNNSNWMNIYAITIDPTNPNIIYIGTSGAGILKSTNGGASLAAAGGGPGGTVRKILIQPSNPSIVFAACTNGIWRSTNSGASWTQVHSGSKEDIEFKPNDVSILYATGNDVYRSSDNGLTWTLVSAAQGITNSGRTLVAVTPANPNYVYIAQASGSLFGRMYKSTDAGLTFTTTVVGDPASGTNYFGYETNGTGTTGQATYDMGMDVSPVNAAEVYIAGIICWKSVNEATSFTPLTAWSLPNSVGYNHADVHGLVWVNSTIYSISDGGIYKSANNGDDWTDLSPGLGIRQFYRLANSPTNANVITGGAQDNGSVTRQASGTWADWLGADGMEGLVSPTNHLNLWGTSQNGSIYRSTNGGVSYSGLPKPSNGQWVTPLAIHPTNETIVYGGWTGVYKSTNSGNTWTNISGATITTTLADLAVAPSDPNYIYASNGSLLYVTTDDGATWATRSAPAVINDIAVDPVNPSKIWIACNSTTNRVMVSTDAGASFTSVSSNLPAIVARAIVVDDNTPRGIYVGMNIGVYYKAETDASWIAYSDNLPLVAINELDIQKLAGKIRVATYGRGIWESPVVTVAPPGGFTFTNPAPVVSACPAPATMSLTLGTTATGGFSNPITLTASAGVPAGTTISFGTNPVLPGNSSVVNLNNANSLAPGSYTITITGTATGATTQTRDITFTLSAGTGPSITQQPVNQSACAGGNTSFTVSAATATAFQWQVSTDGGSTYTNLSNGGVYAGTGTAIITLTGVPLSLNNNRYRCTASTSCGSTTSGAALLTINDLPVISAHPQTVTICSGSGNTFCITATGTNLSYQWQSSPVCGGTWTNIPGAGLACYTVTGVTSGAAYRCVISNPCSLSVVSNCASISVVTAVSITTQPADQTACTGATASFTVAGAGSGILYQWQLSTDGGATYNNISGANTAIYSITGVTPAMNGNKYRCQLSNTACTTPGISNPATLTVQSLPSITTQPQDNTVCTNSNCTFSISAGGTGITYQWQLSTDGGITYIPITGATVSTYSITGTSALMNGNKYRCVVSGACPPAVTSGTATLTVISPVSISTQPVNTELCSGSNASFTVSGSGTGILYQWQVSTDAGVTWSNLAGASSASLSINAVTTSFSGNRYRCLLSNATCTTPTVSAAALLTVRQLPAAGLSAAPLTSLLPGQTTTLTSTLSTSTGGVLTSSWLKNGSVFTNPGTTYTANVETIGTYQVRIQETFSSGLTCSNQSPSLVIDAAISNKLFIFPSPNDGSFTVSYYNGSGTSTRRTVTVYDSKGARVFNARFPVTGAYTLMGIVIQPAVRGIYYVVVGDATGKKLAQGKVLVH